MSIRSAGWRGGRTEPITDKSKAEEELNQQDFIMPKYA